MDKSKMEKVKTHPLPISAWQDMTLDIRVRPAHHHDVPAELRGKESSHNLLIWVKRPDDYIVSYPWFNKPPSTKQLADAIAKSVQGIIDEMIKDIE